MFALIFWLCVLSILYTYFAYPVWLTLLARFKPKPKPYPEFTPALTLLIAAYNEQAAIQDKLENSLALDYPRAQLQILVTADGSDDRTPDIVREYAARGVELAYVPERRGKMAAINRAMPLARGEIVVFSDGNNIYDRRTLRELAAPFSDPSVGAVSGAKAIVRGDGALGESEGAYWKYESFIKKQETRLGCCTGVSGEVWAIRRTLFQMPPDKIINDDFFMAMRIVKKGYRMIYAPNARSSERVSLSAQDEVARRSRIVAGRYQALALAGDLLTWKQPRIVWQVVSHKFMRPLVPLAMIGAFAANALAIIFPVTQGNPVVWLGAPVNWIFLGLQIAFYLLALIGNVMERLSASKLPVFLYLPTFLVNSNFAALVGLYRFVMRRQTTLWQRVQRREGAAN